MAKDHLIHPCKYPAMRRIPNLDLRFFFLDIEIYEDEAVAARLPLNVECFSLHKPENFEELSKQTDWRLSVKAVDEAFNEVNSWIKPEVVALVPEGCIGRAIDEFINQPANIITCARNAARLGCTDSLHEKALMKNWLFATGIHPLQISYEPKPEAQIERKRERVLDDEVVKARLVGL